MTAERRPQIFTKGETEMIRIPKSIREDVQALIDHECARKLDAMARKFEEAASR
jgi:hypothetical protein